MCHIFLADEATLLVCRILTDCGHFLSTDCNLPLSGRDLGDVSDPIWKFHNAVNISQTVKATLFKFGTQVEHGQFLPLNSKFSGFYPWSTNPPISGAYRLCDPISQFNLGPVGTNWPLGGRGLGDVTQKLAQR